MPTRMSARRVEAARGLRESRRRRLDRIEVNDAIGSRHAARRRVSQFQRQSPQDLAAIWSMTV